MSGKCSPEIGTSLRNSYYLVHVCKYLLAAMAHSRTFTFRKSYYLVHVCKYLPAAVAHSRTFTFRNSYYLVHVCGPFKDFYI